jgi:hypothetical protein
MWDGKIDDRCLHCNEFLETRQFSREVERKIRDDARREKSILIIRPEDGPLKRLGKRLLNALRWWTIIMQVLFFIVVTIIIVLISILPG